MRFKCIVSYDGTHFHGFQKQSDLRTVEGVIEDALTKVCKQQIEVYASGRTDKGVHAIGQVIHFDTTINITESGLKRALNSLLPPDVYVKSVEIVDNSFHARYNAIKKEYHYIVDIGEYDPLKANYKCYYMYKNLDIEKIRKSLSVFIGTHDFKTFSKASEEKSTVRTIHSLEVEVCGSQMKFKFVGNGFLHNQVRIITAMILEVGRGKIEVDDLVKAMEAKSRNFAPKLLTGSGLYLYEVFY